MGYPIGVSHIFMPVGLEPQVRVRGARGALPVADTAPRASGSGRPSTQAESAKERVGYRNRTPGTIEPTLIDTIVSVGVGFMFVLQQLKNFDIIKERW